jgi:hypothetical protein
MLIPMSAVHTTIDCPFCDSYNGRTTGYRGLSLHLNARHRELPNAMPTGPEPCVNRPTVPLCHDTWLFLRCADCRGWFHKSSQFAGLPARHCSTCIGRTTPAMVAAPVAGTTGPTVPSADLPSFLDRVRQLPSVGLALDTDLPPMSMVTLISYFGKPCNFPRKAWVDAASCWSCVLLKSMVPDREAMDDQSRLLAVDCAGAFLLLPGLLEELKILKADFPSFFAAMDANHPERGILATARLLVSEGKVVRHSPPEPQAVDLSNPKSVRQVRERIDSLIDLGKISNAMQYVERVHAQDTGGTPPEALSVERMKELLSELHPAANDDDNLEEPALDPDLPPDEILRIDADALCAGVKKLRVGAACGYTGTTNRYIQKVFSHSTHHTEFRDNLGALFNAVLRNEVLPEVWKLFTVGRGVLIPKDAGGWRPLGIGECWYRLQSQCICRSIMKSTSEKLAPLQLGSGFPSGNEISARAAQLAIDAGLAVISIDIKNAFNSMRRKLILAGIEVYCPALKSWFFQSYGHESEIKLTGGEDACMRGTGVSQGDPLAQLLFCLGMHVVLKAIEEKMKNACTTVAQLNPAGETAESLMKKSTEIAFCDDVHISSTTGVCISLLPEVVAVCERYGLTVQSEKCKLLCPSVADIDEEEGLIDIVVTEEGISKMMGVPVGTSEFRRCKLEAALEAKAASLTTITKVCHPQSAFILISQCITARVAYLSSVSELEEATRREVFGKFDDTVLHHLSIIAKCRNDGRFRLLCGLPRRLGGLGVYVHYGPRGAKGLNRSRKVTVKFLQGSSGYSEEEGVDPNAPVQGGYITLLEQRFASWPRTPLFANLYPVPYDVDRADPVADLDDVHNLTKSTFESDRKGILDELNASTEPKDKHLAAWFLSSAYGGSGRCLNWRGGIHKWLQMREKEFIDFLRLRLLLIPISPVTAEEGLVCPCRGLDISQSPSHPLDCRTNRGLYNRRHNSVRDLLASLIRTVMQARVQQEVTLHDGQGNGSTIIADIVAHSGHDRLVFDVTITDPACMTHVTQNGSATRQDAGALHREAKKRAHYSPVSGLCVTDDTVVGANSHQTYRFIPFAVEATGRLGPTALQFIKLLGENADFSQEISMFLYSMCASISRSNSQMIDKCRRSVDYFPRHSTSVSL